MPLAGGEEPLANVGMEDESPSNASGIHMSDVSKYITLSFIHSILCHAWLFKNKILDC